MTISMTRASRSGNGLVRTRRILRGAMLGSTALVAVTLASPAAAQTVSPAGGGTVVGGGGSTDNQTATGGGLRRYNVAAGSAVAVNDVTIAQTVTGPTPNALSIEVPSGAAGLSVTFNGTNNIGTTVSDGAAVAISNTGNLGVSFAANGSTFRGSYGFSIDNPNGFVSFNGSKQSLNVVGAGTAVTGIRVAALLNPEVYLGSSTISGFATGVSVTMTDPRQLYAYVESAGGSINASQIGIRIAPAAASTGNVQSQSAITSPIGIQVTGGGGAIVTTSGTGTINSNAANTGTGILATANGGATAVTVGAAIGNTTTFATAVDARATGAGTTSVTSTAAIRAGTTGISATSAGGANSVTTSGGAMINGGTTGILASGATGTNATTVTVGAAIGGTARPSIGVDVTGAGVAGDIVNVNANVSANYGVHTLSAFTTNVASGVTVSGSTFAVYIEAGGGTVNNAGTLSGQYGILSNVASALTVTNSGTINGTAIAGIFTYSSALSITNSGTIQSSGGGDGIFTQQGGAIANTGTITGGAGRYAIVLQGGFGLSSLVSSGTISANAAAGSTAIIFSTSGAQTLSLDSGSVTNGLVDVRNGTTTGTVAGTLNGTYKTSAGGSDILTVASTGVLNGGAGVALNAGRTIGLTNSGKIVGTTSAITASAAPTTITNQAGGLIGGGTLDAGGAFTAGTSINGIVVGAGGAVTNNGTIVGGSAGRGIQSTAGGLKLSNSGTINGSQGVDVEAGVATLLNRGTITSTGIDAAVIVRGGGTITNANGATITGGTDVNYGNAVQINGPATVNNYGTLSGTGAGGGIYSYNNGGIINLFAGSSTGSILTAGGDDTLALYSGTGTATAAVMGTDPVSGAAVTLRAAGTFGAAITTGTIDLGGGTDTLQLRGTGDGTAANGAAGTFSIATSSGAEVLTKADTGTWTLTGAAITPAITINAGTGGTPGSGGLLIFNGTSGLTGAIVVNGGTIRADTAGAFGTGTITLIDPIAQYNATGTYANPIVLNNPNQATDPNRLEVGQGLTATLTGRISEAVAGQGLTFGLISGATAGVIELNNPTADNNWTGVTTIDAGTTLRAAAVRFSTETQLSGSNIVDNGVLNYRQNFTSGSDRAISGTGSVLIDGGVNSYVILSANNTFTGGTTVDAGGLQVGDGATNGTIVGPIVLVNNGLVAFFRNDNNVNASNISGNGRVRVFGTATLSGAITATGTAFKDNPGTATLSGIRSGATTASDGGFGSGFLLSGNNAPALTVASTGQIQGGQFIGVRVNGRGAAVTNLGQITNTGTGGTDSVGAGVAIYTVGGTNTVTNGSASNSTATISGQNNAINQRGSATTALTINNYGSLTANTYSAFENSGSAGALTVNNFGTAALIYGSNGSNGLNVNSAAGLTLSNQGRIVGNNYAISSVGALSITNSGLIGSGTLSGGAGLPTFTAGGSAAILASAGGTITNGLVSGTTVQNNASVITGSIGVVSNGTLILTNYGTVTGTGGGGVNTASAASRITNYATIEGGTQALVLNNGGTVFNYGSGSILRANNTGNIGDASGIYSNGALALTNEGQISTAGTGAAYGVQVLGQATVTNSGTISAASASGLYFNGANSSITNSGTIAGGTTTTSYGVSAAAGSAGTITQTAGRISGVGGGIARAGGALAIDNTGVIVGTGTTSYGINATAGSGQITNNSGGIVAGQTNGVLSSVAASITNAGTIGAGTVSTGANPSFTAAGAGSGIVLPTGTIINSGLISGGGRAIDLTAATGSSSVTNTATGIIRATVAGSYGVYTSHTLTLVNDGEITAATVAGNFSPGVFVAGANSSVTNNAAGVITGGRGVEMEGGGTLDNYGQVIGTADNAVSLFGGGTVINHVGGTLTALGSTGAWGIFAGQNVANNGVTTSTLTNDGTINAGAGIVAFSSNATISNTGSITAQDAGVWGYSGPAITVTNSGTITATTGTGVRFSAGGTLTNNGAITAATAIAGLGTFTDNVTLGGASTTSGGIDLGAGNDAFVLNTGAVVTGPVAGGAGTDTFTVQGTGATTLAGVISGFESLAKNGAGTLTLSGTNTGFQTVAINTGTLNVSGGNAINDVAAVTVASGAVFGVQASETIGSLAGAGNVSLGANTLTFGDAANTTFSGVASGTGGLTKVGTGVFTISGANTYTGATDVQAGTLRLGASNVLSDSTDLTIRGAATLDLNGFSDTVGSFTLFGTLTGGGVLTANTVNLNGGTLGMAVSAPTVNQQSNTTVLSGAVAGNVITATNLVITGGTLQLGASEQIANGTALTINPLGTLDLVGFDETVASVVTAGTINGTGTLTAATYELQGGTVNANLGNDPAANGNYGSIVFQQSGTTILNGASAAVQVSVNGGTLQLGASERLADTTSLTIGLNGTLNLQGFTETVGYVEIDGVLAGNGTLVAADYQLDGGTVNANLGGGTLTVTPYNNRASVLNGTAAATLVQLQGGTLQLGAADRLADNAAVFVDANAFNGTLGTLDIGTFSDTVGSLTVRGGSTLAGTGTLTAGSYTLNNATVNANLGTGTLTVLGDSTLNGTEAAAAVNVNAGTLTLTASNRLTGGTSLTVAAGASVAGAAFTQVLTGTVRNGGTVSGTLVATAGGALTVDNYGAMPGGTSGTAAIGASAGSTSTILLQAGSTTGAISLGSGNDTLSLFAGVTNAAAVIAPNGQTLRAAGSYAGAQVGAIDLGGGSNTLNLRGSGTGSFNGGAAGVTTLNKLDSGSWTATNVNATTVNAGTFSGTGGTLTLAGTGNIGDVYVNGSELTLGSTTAAGNARIHMIDPTTNFAATGTYLNDFDLAVPAGQQAANPNIFNNTSGGAIVLAGSLTESIPGQYVTFRGGTSTTLSNAANVWTGLTTIDAGANLIGTTATISGGSITDNGTLTYRQATAGSAGQAIGGSGLVVIDGGSPGTALTGAITTQRGVQVGANTVATLTNASGATTNEVAFIGTGATLNVVSGGSVSTPNGNAVNSAQATNTVNNAGTLAGNATYTGVFLSATTGLNTVTNTGTIRGFNAISSSSTLNLTNSGTLTGLTGSSVFAGGAGTVVVNNGTITGISTGTALNSALSLNASSTVTNNAGATISGNRGIAAGGTTGASTVDNYGRITGVIDNAVSLFAGGTATNYAGGTLTATGVGGWGIYLAGGTTTMGDNRGTINADSGIVTNRDGSIATNSGTVTATDAAFMAIGGTLAVTNGGTASGATGARFAAGGSVTNSGSLTGSAYGVDSAGAALTVSNTGTITGNTLAIRSVGAFADSVTLGSTSTTNGGVSLGDGADILTFTTGATATGTLDGGAAIDTFVVTGTGNSTLPGNIVNFEILTKDGTGTLTLGGTNAGFTTVNVNAGTLNVTGGAAIDDTAAVTVATAGTLGVLANETVGTLALAGTLNGPGTLTAATYMLNGATVNGNLGAGALTNTGGVSTLNGTAASTTVNITAGTLALGASDRLADAAAVTVSPGAILDLRSFTDTVGTLALAGTLNGTGTLTAATYTLNAAQVNGNLGTGTLTQAGGVSTLTGTAAAATVNVVAGTLTLGAANRLADTAAVTVASGTVLDLAAFSDTVGSLTLNGTLNGTGTLTAATYALNGATVNGNLGAGALTSTGATTLNGTSGAGTVNVTGGMLSLGAANRLADIAAVTVATGATLNLVTFSDTVGGLALNGTLNGTGTLTAASYTLNAAAVNANLGAGTLTQAGGTSTLAGISGAATVNVNAGVLQLTANERLADASAVTIATGATLDLAGRTETIGSVNGTGAVALGAGRLVLAGAGASSLGALTGTGALDKTGTGTLALASAYASTGQISLLAGTTSFTGTSAGSLRVAGGTLTGTGTAAGGLTLTSGTVAPGIAGATNGSQFGTLTVGGLTASGGSYAVDFGGAATGFAADLIRVNGAATLSGTVAVAPTSFAGNERFQQLYTIVQANSLTGTFANGGNFSAVTNDPALFYRLRYDLVANAVVLQVQRQIDFAAAIPNGTGNQGAVAGALNGAAGLASDSFAATLNAIAAAGNRGAVYDNLSGEAVADVTSSALFASDKFIELVRSRIGLGQGGAAAAGGYALRAGMTGDQRHGSGLAGTMQDGVNAAGGTAGAENGAGLWLQGYGAGQKLEGRAGQATTNSFASGLFGGLDGHFGGFTAGVAGGFTDVDTQVYARNSRIEGTLVQGGGYAGYDAGVVYGAVTGSYYDGDVTVRRQLAVLGGQASGKTNVHGYTVGGLFGTRFDVGGGTLAGFEITGQQTQAVRRAYTESAPGGLGLITPRDSREVFTGTAQLKLSHQFTGNGWTAAPYASGGVRYNSGDLTTINAMRFSGAPTGTGGFLVQGAALEKTVGVFTGGIEIRPSDKFRIDVSAGGAVGNRTHEGQVRVSARIGF